MNAPGEIVVARITSNVRMRASSILDDAAYGAALYSLAHERLYFGLIPITRHSVASVIRAQLSGMEAHENDHEEHF